MPTWVPDGGRDALDELVREIVDLFASAQSRLTGALSMQLRAGLEAGVAGPAQAIRLGELTAQARRVAAWLQQTSPQVLERILETARERGAAAAIQELQAAVGTTDAAGLFAVAPKVSNLAGAQAAVLMRADLTNALADVTRRILRWPDDVYRTAVARSASDVILGLASSGTAQLRAWNDLASQGVAGFTDVAGRRWNLATYVEMATRSATRRAFDDAKVTTMADHGVELVSVVVGMGACQPCTRWAGKILRTTPGPTGRIKVDRVNGPGQVTVTVAGTLDEAKAAGWRHPNCRCSTVAYLPGLSVITDVTTYDPQAEADRAKLRDLERRVRAAKADAAAALDDAGRRDANAKVRALQAQIRQHVADTGLMRQRNREQPNLGHVAI